MKLVEIVKMDTQIVAIMQTVLCAAIKYRVIKRGNTTTLHVSPELSEDEQDKIVWATLIDSAMGK